MTGDEPTADLEMFVGRRDEIDEAIRLLAELTEKGSVRAIVGVHGLGKTTVLDKLAAEAVRFDNAAVFRWDLARYSQDAGLEHDRGHKASGAALWSTFQSSIRLLLQLIPSGAGRDTPEFRAFRDQCEEQRGLLDRFLAHNDIHLGRRSHIDWATISSTVNISEEAVREHIREAQSAIDQTFLDDWTEWARRRRVLLAVDNFDKVAAYQLAQWIKAISRQLPRTLVLVAYVPVDPAPVPDTAERWELRGFSGEEVRTLLDERLGRPVPTGVEEVVYGFTGGHPGGVKLVAELMRQRGAQELASVELRRTLDELPRSGDKPWSTWVGLVDAILDAVGDAQLRDAVDACAAVNTFDEPLLAELLDIQDETRRDAGAAIATLRSLGLVETVAGSHSRVSDRFRLHEFIRQARREELVSVHPRTWEELQRRAAKHYFRRLQAWDEADSSTYGTWYRYEDSEWQALKREWLFHSRQMSEVPELTRARFVLVFLQAFWWRGSYVPSAFNRRLLEDWERHLRLSRDGGSPLSDDPDEFLGRAFDVLLTHYPLGDDKRNAPWDEIHTHLLRARQLCELPPRQRSRVTDEERREITRASGMVYAFLARTRRLADPHDEAGLRYYRKATEIFKELAEPWMLAWLHFHLADLSLERSEPAAAFDLVRDAAGHLIEASGDDEDWDEELIANLYRARADARLAAGDAAGAVEDHQRAVLHAYLFQGAGSSSPDEYTSTFYAEITRRAGEVQRRLDLPRGPAPDELHRIGSVFMDEWRVFNETVEDSGVDVQALREKVA